MKPDPAQGLHTLKSSPVLPAGTQQQTRARHTICQMTVQTDGPTDACMLHRPSSAYDAVSVNKSINH